jgi:hypothetical protein
MARSSARGETLQARPDGRSSQDAGDQPVPERLPSLEAQARVRSRACGRVRVRSLALRTVARSHAADVARSGGAGPMSRIDLPCSRPALIQPVTMAAALVALALGGMAGCGHDDGGVDGGATAIAGTSVLPAAAPAQWARAAARAPRARRRGHRRCAHVAPRSLLSASLEAAKRDAGQEGPDATLRASLTAQAERLGKSTRSDAAAASVAAALYAVSLPRAQRAGAYAGCMRELRKNLNR